MATGEKTLPASIRFVLDNVKETTKELLSRVKNKQAMIRSALDFVYKESQEGNVEIDYSTCHITKKKNNEEIDELKLRKIIAQLVPEIRKAVGREMSEEADDEKLIEELFGKAKKNEKENKGALFKMMGQ